MATTTMQPPASSTTSPALPAHLVDDSGGYSDERFIDMIIPHHRMAIEHSQVLLERSQDTALRAMGRKMISDQQAEIAEIKAIKQRDFGSAETPTETHPESMRNSGTMTTAQLQATEQIDKAFIDSMIPHHGGAIPLGSTVLIRSSHAELRAMARKIVSAQAREIGDMIEMRMLMFGTAEYAPRVT